MHPKEISIKDYTYNLPTEKIAINPTNKRRDSKLLFVKNGKILDNEFKDLPDLLDSNYQLIFNNSKVIPARFIFEKPSGGKVELFFLEPLYSNGNYAEALSKKNHTSWKCLVGGLSKWKSGKITCATNLNGLEIICYATYIKPIDDAHEIFIEWQPQDYSVAEIFVALGKIPLPPYMQREAIDDDIERYQTTYALLNGSVAAPTAGLHFDEDVFTKIKEKNIHILFTTLHVGAGTFKPVKSNTMEEHPMHEEWIVIDIDLIKNWLLNIDKKTIAVGTTSLRTLETIYWIGVKIHHQLIIDNNFHITQWETYSRELQNCKTTLSVALESILNYLKTNNTNSIYASTAILIAPGYTLNTVAGLITNFHQPQSTLLLLVAALVGDNWKNIYDFALNNNYRFLSYGDSSLLLV